MNSEARSCQNCKQNFVIEPEDFNFYQKISVPPPTWCPECRLVRRIVWRNERSLYKDTCDLCKKSLISMYSPDKPFLVYCRECWYSDRWDPLDYGREYDWNTPFFEQFRELYEEVPRVAIAHYPSNTNVDYANYVHNGKNVYLSYSVVDAEEVYYSRFVDKSKDCFDCLNIEESELVYETIDGDRNNRTNFMYRSRECIESSFLFNCSGCQNCFMSSNLRNKQYVLRNRQLTKEQYGLEIKQIGLGNHSLLAKLKEEFRSMVRSSLHKYANLTKTTNSTGDNVENSKNVKFAFDTYDAENLKYTTRIIGTKDSYDLYGCAPSELMYEYVAGGFGSYRAVFSVLGNATRESFYTEWCHDSSNMFGCVNVRKRQHCILNKQHTKEEYEQLVPKIIEHMNSMPYRGKNGRSYAFGEFFPLEIAPFAYNETIAQEILPLTKEEAEQKGLAWRDPDQYPHNSTVAPENLPDDIRDVQDSILNEVIGCPACGRAYRIIKAELDFLRRRNIALPRKCENCRYLDRLSLRNPMKLWHRTCRCAGIKSDDGIYINTISHFHGADHCPNEFETSYAPDRPEIVYCEQCYNAEVV